MDVSIQTQLFANALIAQESGHTPWSTGTEFVDDPRMFKSGLLKKDQVGSDTPDNHDLLNNLIIAAKAGMNGAWFNWFGRLSGTGDKTPMHEISEVPNWLQLIRVVANWDNLNGVPLANRSFSGTTYTSANSRMDENIIYARQPKTQKLFVVFLNDVGEVTLNPGEKIISIKRVDALFCETSDGTDDLTVSGNKVKLSPHAAGRQDTVAANPGRTTLAAVEQAHAKLWSGHVDRNGIILDYIGDIPTTEDCALGKPNAIGWRSPLANGAMFTGLYLPAACERARRSGTDADKENVQRLAAGLLKCASVSDVPGFIARGIGTDGRCHYPAGSDDQSHPWFLGLHAYLQSGLPSAAERAQIVDKMKQIANALESTGWKCPCDGAFKGQFRGGFQGHLFRDAVRYLHMLRVMAEVTGDNAWLERYRKAAAERPAKSDKTRAEICAAGYSLDREAIKGIDEHSLWIYVGSQAALAKLAALETEATLRERYRAGLAINAANVRAALETCKEFDNADTQVFGHANWRAVDTNWFVQRTQADAEKLAECEDKAKGGKRKAREARYVRNPLAAAAIAALAGESASRDAIERALCHYDYAQLNMSEFFFAECAYYALPAKP